MPLDPVIGGALIGAGSSALEGLATSAFNVHENRQNRRFQRDMANTSHQREVKDLIAAGLNPILSANGGAPVPSGGAATVEPTNAVQKGIDAATGYQKTKESTLQQQYIQSQIADVNSARALKDAQKGDILFNQKERLDNLIAQTQATLANTSLVPAQKNEILQRVSNLKSARSQIEVQTQSSAADLNKKQVQGGLWNKAGNFINKAWKQGESIWKNQIMHHKNGATGRW